MISPVFTARAWCERRAPRWAPTSSRTSCSLTPPRVGGQAPRDPRRAPSGVSSADPPSARAAAQGLVRRESPRADRARSRPVRRRPPRATHHRPARSDSTHRRRNPRDRIETHPRRVSARPSRPRARAGRARRGDARHERPPRSNLARLDVEGCVDGCYRDELTRARASVLEHAASLKTHDETRRFVAEGFPGFVGRTHRCAVAAERRVASDSSASDDDAAEDARTDAASERAVGVGTSVGTKRRRSHTPSTLDATVSDGPSERGALAVSPRASDA